MELLINYWPVWVGAVTVVAVILLLGMYSSPARLPYRVRPRLVTKSELSFYRSLVKAVQDDFEIMAMVRMADLIRVEVGTPNRRKWLNKVLAKHIDFVLCDRGSLQPLVCIELDDRSHQRADRIERDKFVDHAFESAGLPLIRIPVSQNYPPREVRELIDQAMP